MRISILAALIVLLAFALASAQVSPAASGPSEFTVAVSAGGTTEVRLGVPATHLRISSASADLRCYMISFARNSSGVRYGTIRKPPALPDVTGWPTGTEPSPTSNFYTILDQSITIWNTYVNVRADSLVVYSVGGSAASALVQVITD